MQNNPSLGVEPARRRFIGGLLGGGLFASAVSFLYPVLRYIVPPTVIDLGNQGQCPSRISSPGVVDSDWRSKTDETCRYQYGSLTKRSNMLSEDVWQFRFYET